MTKTNPFIMNTLLRSLVLASLLFGVPSLRAAGSSDEVKKVAILPFTMHVPADLAYLQAGVRDMLTSRLAWQGKVEVINKSSTDQAMRGAKSEISADEAVRIGKSLHADYVLFGSLTALGKSVSIDARMAPAAANGEPLHLYTQTKDLDEVIPKVNQFAQEINHKLFGRADEKTAASSAENESAMTRNPELLVAGAMGSGDKSSYLNPNFIELMPEGALRQPGLWRSQTFQGAVLGMDLGDLDGDGKKEMVTITARTVTVFKRVAHALQPVATLNGTGLDHFIWVTVVDTKRSGKAEIYVTNLRSLNNVGAADLESPNGAGGFQKELSSFALTLENGKLKTICKGIPYFLNGITLRDRGKVLIGQRKGALTQGPFDGQIHEMQIRGNTLAQTAAVNVPKECNVFNFARVDLDNDHINNVVYIDKENHLVVASSTGDVVWKSKKVFGATTNSFEGRVQDRRVNDVDLYSIPPAILVTDLNKDGIPEIIVTRSTDILSRFLPAGAKFYDKGEIVSLSWDQLGMVENWKTREIGGMVTSIRVAEPDDGGQPQLLASLVLAKDFMKLWESKSTIFGYDLNTTTAPETKTAAK
jgi:TolB-like protein